MNLGLSTHTAFAVTSPPMAGWLWLAHQMVLSRHDRYEPSHAPILIYAGQLVLELQDDEAASPDFFLHFIKHACGGTYVRTATYQPARYE